MTTAPPPADRYRPITDPDQARFVHEEIRRHLITATERGTESLNCSGVSFVLMGTRVWLFELAEIDARATADYFRCLAKLVDPRTPPARRKMAEQIRQRQFQHICRKASQPTGDAS